jgi:hypothetical protein
MPSSSPAPPADVPAAVPAEPAPPVVRALLEDGSLALRAEAAVWDLVALWMPRIPSREAAPGEVRAWIQVEAGPPAFRVPAGPPELALQASAGWLLPSGEVLLCERERRVSAVADPAALRATVRFDLPDGASDPLKVAIFEALTLPAALLLGRLGRALVHAGAVVAPDGRAWLLAGGTFSGKSSTCITLIRGGWDWLGDDHVLLARDSAGLLRVEGWPRKFNLDQGYAAGASRGVRGRVDPEGFGPGRWRRAAPLGGVLFPRVEAERPTALAPLAAADPLARLLDLSPWLLADPGAAPDILALLQAAALTPAYELRLGNDCYGDPALLQLVLRPALDRGWGTTSPRRDGDGPADA